MKINTDGVLLGALAESNPSFILDIGTGTGVIALMLAQRFGNAKIDAVEIDESAADTAQRNFQNSPFANWLNIYTLSFKDFFERHPSRQYDLIVSNPPFYINSLLSPTEKKQLAKHTDHLFFEDMLNVVSKLLSAQGSCWLILPLQTAELVKVIAASVGLHLNKVIYVRSFAAKEPHRKIIVLSRVLCNIKEEQFVIYESEGVYTQQYKNTLKEFFTIF
ncbi:tRNA1(Val) (adenine(37)-N6)-methyltransferase [Mucilaginibacter sp. HD30]